MGHAATVIAAFPVPATAAASGHSAGRRRPRWAGALIGAAIAASCPLPAAASEPRARLVPCEKQQSCLQISGRRDDAAAVVTINGRAVPVEGARRWRVRLPVEVVRQWSAPFARTIEVALHDPATQRASVVTVALPIGLLGGSTELASLVVSAR